MSNNKDDFVRMDESDYPALYNAADSASLAAQAEFFHVLRAYLILLVVAAAVAFSSMQNAFVAIISAALFLITLGLLIWLKVKKPEDIWYNGRAVAESVKTRTWRWIMRADPYESGQSWAQAQKEFLADLKSILSQNRSLSQVITWTPDLGEAISDKMIEIRSRPWAERLDVYRRDRISNQSLWYSKKTLHNRRRSRWWFITSVLLHSLAILLLLYRIKTPMSQLPIEVVATAAGAVLTWVQAKKHNELHASYALAAHEIVLIKSETTSVSGDKELSEYVVSSEAAFSREHTQWVARKNV